MFLVNHQQLIGYTAQCEEDCPRIYFPTRLLCHCTLTIGLFFLLIFLMAYPILAGAVIFLLFYTGYYLYLFSHLLRTLCLSCGKYAVLLALLAAMAYGLAQLLRAGVHWMIF